MGESKRKGRVIARAPYTYQIGAFRVADILARAALAIVRDETPSLEAHDILTTLVKLKRRMQDPQLPTMLCMSCDYEFRRDEAPVEIVIALPFANRAHPPIASPLCPRCAAADPERKLALIRDHWRTIDPTGQIVEPGNA